MYGDSEETRSQKRVNLRAANNDLVNLAAEGYHVLQMTPWHWRITKDDYHYSMDVWPSARKAQDRDSRIVYRYEDLFAFLKKHFSNHMP